MSAAWFVLLLAAACSPQRDQGRRFELTGVVAGRDAASSRVLIAHEAIEGLMPAMTMPFEVTAMGTKHDGPQIPAGVPHEIPPDALAICGVPISREITPDLRRALALKPRQEDFI